MKSPYLHKSPYLLIKHAPGCCVSASSGQAPGNLFAHITCFHVMPDETFLSASLLFFTSSGSFFTAAVFVLAAFFILWMNKFQFSLFIWLLYNINWYLTPKHLCRKLIPIPILRWAFNPTDKSIHYDTTCPLPSHIFGVNTCELRASFMKNFLKTFPLKTRLEAIASCFFKSPFPIWKKTSATKALIYFCKWESIEFLLNKFPLINVTQQCVYWIRRTHRFLQIVMLIFQMKICTWG